jgi:hypothetical protein
MQPIRIIDANFNLLGEIDEYTSLQWIRRWHKPGEFELHLPPIAEAANLLQEGVLVFRAHDKTEAGIINYRKVEQKESGEENLVVKGKFLAGVLERRVTVPPEGQGYDRGNGPFETIMKQYVDHNCVNPVDLDRAIPNLVVATDQGRGANTTYQTRYKVLSDELEKLSISSGLSWEITLDTANSRWVFDVLEGRDLTAGQSLLPPVVFSTEFDNIAAQSLTISSATYKNTAYVGGQGEEIARRIVEVSGGSGLARREMFVDARDIGSTDENPLTPEEEEALLIDRGTQKLAEYGRVESLEAEILTVSNLVYREDFDLGDLVIIRHRAWGVEMNARIIEVKEVLEANKNRIDVTFGNNLPTFTELIKRELR